MISNCWMTIIGIAAISILFFYITILHPFVGLSFQVGTVVTILVLTEFEKNIVERQKV